jgi:hypothetical protein
VKAAEALEALVDNNASAQKAFLDLDAPLSLMRVLKVSVSILSIHVLNIPSFWEMWAKSLQTLYM